MNVIGMISYMGSTIMPCAGFCCCKNTTGFCRELPNSVACVLLLLTSHFSIPHTPHWQQHQPGNSTSLAAAPNMTSADAHIAAGELEKQIAALHSTEDPASKGRALALLTVLLSRCPESEFLTVAGALPTLTELASQSADQLVQVSRQHRVRPYAAQLSAHSHRRILRTLQANAVAALAATAALDDDLAAAVAAAAVSVL
jgi:hypothetical protein